MERRKIKSKARELIKGRVFRIFFFLFITTALIPAVLSSAISISHAALFNSHTSVAVAGHSVPIGITDVKTTVLTKSEWASIIDSLEFVERLRLSLDRSVGNVVVEGDRYFSSAESREEYRRITNIIDIVINCAIILTTGALTFSGVAGMLKVDKNKKAPRLSEDFFTGFKSANYARAIIAYFRVAIFTFLWSLLFIIPGIMKTYSYAMTIYILADNPKLSAKEAQKKSIVLMQGHRFEYFKLQLSFFWWYLLIGLTFGLASFYVAPYFETSKMLFYKKLAQK